MLHQASQPEVRRSGRAVCRLTCLLLLLAGPTVGVCQSKNRLSDKLTTIELTDRVLVKDTVRFGINLGGDAYYSGAVLVKKRVRENFEGTSYRQCHFGPLQDATGATTWFRASSDWDEELLPGAQFTILSGPAKGISGTITEVSTRKVEHQGQLKDFRYFVFDRRVPPGGMNVGLLVEKFRLGDGQFRPLDGYWTSKNNKIFTGDVPSDSFGTAAALLDGSEEKAHLRFSTHYQRFGETNGRWNVHFWAKSHSGRPRLVVLCDPEQYGRSNEVELTHRWKKYELTLLADSVPEPASPDDNPMLRFRFDVAGGGVLLDDVEIWMDGDTNPTAFRDDCVAMLEKFQPGNLRRLQMGGSTVDNTIGPILRSHTYTSQNGAKAGPYQRHSKDPYSLHEMYQLCEHLGCEPWYTLPGTLHQEEMIRFMEYLGAPEDEGHGRRRAELGHPRPWTETLGRIHVEFGNEAWNNAGPYQCGGFNGEDYWKDLIAAAKASPYYRQNVVFHVGGQAANSWLNGNLMPRFPNADRFSVAPYILHNFSAAEAAALDTNDKLFRWATAYPIWRSRHPEGAMAQNFQAAKKAGIEMSVYEVNHHLTGGDGPLEPRNRIVTSIGGGINVAHSMLLMLKEHGMRDQCLFSLAQLQYNARGVGPVRLWGTALCMRKGHERYRPTFLACAAANRALGGDLVQTRHSGADPTFSATGVFQRRKEAETIGPIPEIFSYGFVDGAKRRLILVNLSTTTAHRIALKLNARPASDRAQSWLLSADSITDHNEFEVAEPQVALRTERIEDFLSGWQSQLPPFSMRVLAWEVKP